MVILFINSKELLENLILVINSTRLSNIIKKTVGYNLDIMRHSACLVENPGRFINSVHKLCGTGFLQFLLICVVLGPTSL